MKDRYVIRRKDNKRYYFTRNSMNAAKEIKALVEGTTKIEHEIYDRKTKEVRA